jgi:hypothetical protein
VVPRYSLNLYGMLHYLIIQTKEEGDLLLGFDDCNSNLFFALYQVLPLPPPPHQRKRFISLASRRYCSLLPDNRDSYLRKSACSHNYRDIFRQFKKRQAEKADKLEIFFRSQRNQKKHKAD